MSKNIFLLALVLGKGRGFFSKLKKKYFIKIFLFKGLFKSYSQQVTTCYVGTSGAAVSGYSCASSTVTIGSGSTTNYCVVSDFFKNILGSVLLKHQ